LSEKKRNKKWSLPSVNLHRSTGPSISVATSTPKTRRHNAAQSRATSNSFLPKQTQPRSILKSEAPQRKLEDWAARKIALKQKYPGGWKPTKRLSPDAMDGIRILHRQV
jgi:hypothetical protein